MNVWFCMLLSKISGTRYLRKIFYKLHLTDEKSYSKFHLFSCIPLPPLSLAVLCSCAWSGVNGPRDISVWTPTSTFLDHLWLLPAAFLSTPLVGEVSLWLVFCFFHTCSFFDKEEQNWADNFQDIPVFFLPWRNYLVGCWTSFLLHSLLHCVF